MKKKFKIYYQFGFTGTPIFAENTMDGQTTAGVFGHELHAYVVTDAILDGKVLKFKVDYNDVRPQFHSLENESDEEKISRADYKKMMRHPNRIREVAQYILDNFTQKTRRRWGAQGGFNAMFAVDSVDSAKAYYEAFKELQDEPQNQSANRKPLKVATIFSFAANEEQGAKGNIADESFELSALNSTAKEFLSGVIDDYNQTFKTNFGVDSKGFQDYYRELAKKVQTQEVDLLIVVGMFLTGFDAPQLNTLFVDKNLSYHGLIQAFSRTNRIYNANKPFGNIVCFRNLEQATIDALKLFGKSSTREMILEKSYQEYMQGFEDIVAGKSHRGYIAVVEELNERFPQGVSIESEQDKKDFARLFGEYLRAENVLLNYDEFDHLKAFQAIDKDDPEAIEAFKAKYFLSDEDITGMQGITVIPERMVQDYRSHYHDIRQERIQNRESNEQEDSGHDWDGIVFEVDLLKSQEINLDYILGLLYESGQQAGKTKDELIEDARRLLRSSVDNRAKEELIVDFIRGADLDQMPDKADLIAAFYTFAQKRLKKAVEDIISTEGLKEDAAIRYIKLSLKQEHASDIGTGLSDALPKMSPLNPKYKTRKQRVFEKMVSLVERFKGVGGYD